MVIKNWLKLKNEVEVMESELSHKKWLLEKALEEMKVGVTHSGGSGDSEYWEQWWVFPSTKTDAEIEKAMYNLGIGEHYGGAGQSFAHNYSYYRRGTRVLVTQTGGLDI